MNKIAIIGKFTNIFDEEYIARSFEMLGCHVDRIPQHLQWFDIKTALEKSKPDILLFTKWNWPNELDQTLIYLKRMGTKLVSWLFDIYFDYPREYQIRNAKFFKADYVFTTDNGHNHRWPAMGINHHCIRQGIFAEECYMADRATYKYDVVFIGSENPMFMQRNEILYKLDKDFKFTWFGRKNTAEKRSHDLNRLFAETKIVVGDSYPSPRYWSNRIVETLGRGGFLIHREVEGLKEEYPHLVTYNGTYEDLKKKISYYLEHDKEREEIIIKNFNHVKDNFTMDKKCKQLLQWVNQ